MRKSLLAFVSAPFPAALFQSLVVAIWPKPGMGVFEHPASMFVVICLYGYAFGAVLGIPIALWLNRRGSRGRRDYALAGLISWSLPIVIGLGFALRQGQLSLYATLYNLGLFGIGGLVAGILFWRINRPDLALKATPAA